MYFLINIIISYISHMFITSFLSIYLICTFAEGSPDPLPIRSLRTRGINALDTELSVVFQPYSCVVSLNLISVTVLTILDILEHCSMVLYLQFLIIS